VLVGDRGAEEGDNGVADELLHRPAVPLELVPQPSVVRREHRPDVLRIELLRARGEAHQVGEQDGDDLALLARRRTRRTKRSPTGPAELEAGRILLAASHARL